MKEKKEEMVLYFAFEFSFRIQRNVEDLWKIERSRIKAWKEGW